MRATSDWKTDIKGEQIVSSWLDKKFYQVLKEKNAIKDFHRTSDMNNQLQGVDIKILFNDNTISFADEKVQLERINKPTPTQCLELYSGKNKIGWFLNKNNITSHYLFFTLNCVQGKTKYNFTEQDILSMKCIFISKKVLYHVIRYVMGITCNDLYKYIQKANNGFFDEKRDYNGDGKYNGYIYLPNGNMKIVKSLHKTETPVNLVIKMSVYEKYANYIFHIDNNCLIETKRNIIIRS